MCRCFYYIYKKDVFLICIANFPAQNYILCDEFKLTFMKNLFGSSLFFNSKDVSGLFFNSTIITCCGGNNK